MAKEILFRGKEIIGEKWREGHLVVCKNNGRTFITELIEVDIDSWLYWEVDPATVGQYTGLTDKNDTKIFEGDIVRRHEEPFNLDNIGIVVYDKVTGSFRLNVEKYGTLCGYPFVSTDTYNDGYCTVGCKVTFEVLGNKFDNPELIKN